MATLNQYSGNDASDFAIAVTSALSVLAMFAMVLTTWFLLLRHLTGTTRIVATFATYAVSGAVRGLVFQLLIGLVSSSESTSRDFTYRMATHPVLSVALLATGTFVVALSRLQRARIAEVAARQASVDAVLSRIATDMSTNQQEAVDAIDAQLSRELAMLREDSPTAAIEGAQVLVADVVRPMSHRLARDIPKIEVPRTDPNDYAVSWRAFWRDVPIEQYIQPFWSAALVAAYAIIGLVSLHGARGVLGFLAGMPLLVLGLWIASRLARMTTGVRTPRFRFAVSTLVILLATIPAATVTVIVIGPGPDQVHTAVATSVVVPVLVWLVAVGFAMRAKQLEFGEALDQLESELIWCEARGQMTRWHQSGQLARALHGPIQSELHATLLILRTAVADGTATKAMVNELTTHLSKELPRILSGSDSGTSIRSQVQEIEKLWFEVVEIDATLDDVAIADLDADPIASDILSNIIQDAVSNAIRHGNAKSISLRLIAADRAVDLEVLDDGNGTPPSPRGGGGLGTTQLRDCAVHWQLTRDDFGCVLTASLPVGTTPLLGAVGESV